MNSQHGVILIIVLWFIVIVSVLVGTLASETRLSAKAVFHNKMGLQTWSDTLTALRLAEMELFILKMPLHPDHEDMQKPLSERINRAYRFNGQVVDLAYPAPKTVKVRIYDHAGRINLRRISQHNLRELLKKIGGFGETEEDAQKLNELMDAWEDWKDSDDMKRANGAEKEEYKELEQPYKPRNGEIETLEEVLLIKGFDEIFKNISLNTAFTVYGTQTSINPNVATREALAMIPGLNSNVINAILSQRREKELKTYNDIMELVDNNQEDLKEFSKARSWLSFNTGNYYTIAIQQNTQQDVVAEDETSENTNEIPQENPTTKQETFQVKNERAFMVTVQFEQGNDKLPKVLRVDPYGVLPDTRHSDVVPSDEEGETKRLFEG